MSSAVGSGLAELKDYVFLSDPTANSVFIIERDGRIWLYDETLPPGQPHGQRRALLDNYTVAQLGGSMLEPVSWSWRDGWLPVLQIRDAAGKKAEILVNGDTLWLCLDDEVTAFPGQTGANAEMFEDQVRALREYWQAWFAQGLVLPPIDGFWDNAWRSSWVQAKMIYGGHHPRYGTGTYTEARSDGFPPTTLSMVPALLAYQHFQEAKDVYSYFLDRFVLPDGRIDYYGPAISEYGGLLSLAAEVSRTADGGCEWLLAQRRPLFQLMRYLIRCKDRCVSQVDPVFGLIMGSPEADTRSDKGAFFHNNMFAWRGLKDFAVVLRQVNLPTQALEAEYHAADLAAKLTKALASVRRPGLPIPSRIDCPEGFASFTESREAAYVNYRYYPEMLETGFLAEDDARGIVRAREELGGDLHGTTIFAYPGISRRLDDWPICSYARALLEMEDRERFMKTLNGHARHHHAADTFTAYEQVEIEGDPRLAAADWCVPCQLALPRLLAWSIQYQKRDGSVLKWDGPIPGRR